MIAKSLCFAAILAIFFAVSHSFTPQREIGGLGAKASNGSHDLIVGAREPSDRMAFNKYIYKPESWLQVVTHEETFNVSVYDRITQVRALDQKTNGKGASASLLAGGPGTNFVTLRFKSQRGHSIKFVVELYAKPRYFY